MSHFSHDILSAKKYNQKMKFLYPNQIGMLFRTPIGNDRNYGYVLYKPSGDSAKWFKRKKDARLYLKWYQFIVGRNE